MSSPQPVVLPLRPRAGWRQAGRAQRLLVLLAAVLLTGWTATLGLTRDELDRLEQTSSGPLLRLLVGLATAAVLVGGPPACHAVARVLRPHPPGTGAERVARHWCAATATAYGLAVLTWVGGLERGVPLVGSGAGWVYVPVAAVLGPVTLLWGVVVAAHRLAERVPLPARGGRREG